VDDYATNSEETRRLLQQVQAGDRAALDGLLSRHRRYLQQFVELRLDPRLRPRVDPSDVVQEAQLEALLRLPAYLDQHPMPFRLWLRQLAFDRVVMLSRSHLGAVRRAVQREVALPDHSSLLLAQQLRAAGPTPSETIDHQELVLRVRHAVAELPEADREILLLRTFEGLSFEEVAFLLGIEPAAARKRHGRALLRLHRILSDDGLTESQV
jgi:RNA polymerase sigma-70 factor (ECF subfamily)